jgi:hypothetical protein
MLKLRFEFVVTAADKDPKTNTLNITSITTEEGEKYELPEEYRNITHHSELKKTDLYNKVKANAKRHDRRVGWVQLTEELQSVYSDEMGNIQFKGQLLNIASEKDKNQDSTLNKLLEQLVKANTKPDNEINLKKITEKFVLEKYAHKTTNTQQWMRTFEKECERFKIEENNMRIEALRLFLDKSCMDWYQATLSLLEIDDNWAEWKKRFVETFADKGWNSWRYALAFRYKEGTLISYATKKERLLLDVNKKMDPASLVAIIIAGIPDFIADKIDQNEIKDSTSLFNEIRKYESLTNKKIVKDYKLDNKKRTFEKKPCNTCETLGKGTRYHPEEKCWFKEHEKSKNKSGIIGNTSVLEVELNNQEKNL